MIDVRQLQYFVSLSAEGTFARAAERQHITQSALSQQIARLERELGLLLFDRGARGARLTAAGEELLPLARRLLGDLVAFHARAASIAREARSELRIGSPSYAVRSPARQRLLAEFARVEAQVEVTFENAWSPQLLQRLVEGDLDLSLAMLAPDDLPLDYRLVQDEPALVILPAGHRLAERSLVSLADLRGETVLLYPASVNAWLRERMEAPLCRAGASVDDLEESSLPAALDQVLSGRGLFPAVPWELDFVNPAQLEGLVVVPSSGEPGLRYALWLARRAGEVGGALEAFWRCAERTVHATDSHAFGSPENP